MSLDYRSRAQSNQRYVVKGSVGQQEDKRYVVKGSVGQEEDKRYVVKGSVGQEEDKRYVVKGSVGQQEDKRYVVKGSVGTQEARGRNPNAVKKVGAFTDTSLIELVFSWTIDDILNKNLYKDKVKQIPETFVSINHYRSSFFAPLIEETHADLCSSMTTLSQAPVCEILYGEEDEKFQAPDNLLYKVFLKKMTDIKEKLEAYVPEVGDLIAITDVKPEVIDDLDRPGRPYVVGLVHGVKEKEDLEVQILTVTCIDIERVSGESKKRTHFAVFLTNMTTNLRIWKALNAELNGGNISILKAVLQKDGNETCESCLSRDNCRDVLNTGEMICPSNLNDSQEAAILSCISTRKCNHCNHVKLICGPPGTGKTKTVASLLFTLLGMKCRTLTCAPTNIAVVEVASRLLNFVMESLEYDTYGLGDIVLFGNGERMKIDDRDDLIDVFIDHRAEMLAKCFSPLTGWDHCLQSMISLLEDPAEHYHRYLQKDEEKDDENSDNVRKHSQHKDFPDNKKQKNNQRKGRSNGRFPYDVVRKPVFYKVVDQTLKRKKKNRQWLEKVPSSNVTRYCGKDNGALTFEEFIKKEFGSIAETLKSYIITSYTHLPTAFIPVGVVKHMIRARTLLTALSNLLQSSMPATDIGKQIVNNVEHIGGSVRCSLELNKARKECLSVLKSLSKLFTVPDFFNQCRDVYSIKNFCLKNAILFFSTASSSVKLHSLGMTSVEFLVIDEAAQLKECESAIPLQLSGLRHAILIGDEHQLPALVKSEISREAEFGRSLFERLVLLGHRKHLLNIQYRMHPSISSFPNREFYDNQILDGVNVKDSPYKKCFLEGKMYGSFSFINVGFGREELDSKCSWKNMVEVAVVAELVQRLSKVSVAMKQKISVGVISPYKAQVSEIQRVVGKLYRTNTNSEFSVSVRSVDGFQGGEDDIIIISTVRCNGNGSVGFLSDRRRANVALTRARYSLWILGSGATLWNSDSVWKKVVLDAKDRDCFHDANDDNSLAQAIILVLLEQNLFSKLLIVGPKMFNGAVWKVSCSNDFWKSMMDIRSSELHQKVLLLIEKLLAGWRKRCLERMHKILNDTVLQMVKVYDVDGHYNLMWSVEVIKEGSKYFQVLKIWDILPLYRLPVKVKNLNFVFRTYPRDLIYRCNFKCVEGNLEVPKTWHEDSEVVKFLSRKLESLKLKRSPYALPFSLREHWKAKLKN